MSCMFKPIQKISPSNDHIRMDTLEDLTDVIYVQNDLKEISTLNDYVIINNREIPCFLE